MACLYSENIHRNGVDTNHGVPPLYKYWANEKMIKIRAELQPWEEGLAMFYSPQFSMTKILTFTLISLVEWKFC